MFAIAYARWSSMEQTKGSTLARQLAATSEHIAAMGWQTMREPLVDRGRSAYTGENIEKGQLGAFAKSILSGAIDASKTVLVVEELDRLSRQPADVMLSWLSPLVRAGLSIKVVSTGQLINRAMLDTDMGGLMMILITSFGSHTESRKKAQRVSASWEAKRKAAREGKPVTLSHRHPKWLEVVDGEWHVPDHKREIVELIFSNRIAGIGKGLTAKRLNELAQSNPASYAPWPLDGKSALPKMWTATYVGRVLRNRAVIGEWQPWHRPKKGEARPAGEPIADYYPQIISPADFERANEARTIDALKHQGRGKSLSNLLGTRARCAVCGGQMAARGSAGFKTNKAGKRHRHYFLYCEGNKVAGKCDNAQGWNYDKVEGPILDTLLTLAMDDQHFGGTVDTAPLERAVYDARATITDLKGKIALLLDALEVGGDAAKDRLKQRNAELASAKERLEAAETALAAAKGKVSPAEHLKRVAEVRALMWSDDADEQFQARSRIKAALGDLIDKISFHPATGLVSVLLVDRARLFSIAGAVSLPRGGNLKKHADIEPPRIVSDLDLTTMGAGPGYGVVTIREGGQKRTENDLSPEQHAASAAYIRRKDAQTA